MSKTFIKYALDEGIRVCRYRQTPTSVFKGEWFNESTTCWVKTPVVEVCWYTTAMTLDEVSEYCKRNGLDYRQVVSTTAYEDTESLLRRLPFIS